MLKFRTQVRWDESLATREEQAKSARYYCEACNEPWDDAKRWSAVEKGQWKAHAPFNGIAGFWISELYSQISRNALPIAGFTHEPHPSEKQSWEPALLAWQITQLCRQAVPRALELRDLATINQVEDKNRHPCHRQTGDLQAGGKKRGRIQRQTDAGAQISLSCSQQVASAGEFPELEMMRAGWSS